MIWLIRMTTILNYGTSTQGNIDTVYSLLDGEYEFIEIISEKSELVNKKIRDSNLPEDIKLARL